MNSGHLLGTQARGGDLIISDFLCIIRDPITKECIMFNLELSVSIETPTNKENAREIIKFEIREFVLTADKYDNVRKILQNHNYSTNEWNGGHCKNENFSRMTGVTLDVDDGLTLEEAKVKFKGYNYVIHTSTSHRKNLPKKGGVRDRFRIILPFSPALYATVNTRELAYSVYDYLLSIYPFMDPACREPARKYYPFLNADIPELFELYVNDVGNYFHVDLEQIAALRINTRGNMSQPRSLVRHDLKLEDRFMTSDGHTTIQVKDVMKKTRVLCPYHEDTTSSGFIEKHPEGQYYFHCKACDLTNWVPFIALYPDLFYVNNKLCRISAKPGQGVTLGEAPAAYLNDLAPPVIKRLTNELANKRWYVGEQLRLVHMVSPDGQQTQYDFNEQAGVIKTYNVPIEVNVKDNEFVDIWLTELFGKYTDFIRTWLAIFCHTDHKPLPVLVFTGPRGTGKSTFGQFVADIYPPLSMEWRGEKEAFNPYVEKKLLIVDEGNVNRHDQYNEIKKITGMAVLTVHRKYMQPYTVPNNINIILLTNQAAPMYLVNSERPEGEHDNQFFMYSFAKLNRNLDADMRLELQQRAGHYVRTRLRDVYENWTKTRDRKNRYSIAVPITDLERQQFNDAMGHADYECLHVLKACLHGLPVRDHLGYITETLGPYDVINAGELKQLIKVLKIDTKNIRTFRERMQNLGYFSRDAQATIKNGDFAWRVIGKIPK